MTATMTRPERSSKTAKNTDTTQARMLRDAIESLSPTPSAPEWASPETLRNVGNGFGGPY